MSWLNSDSYDTEEAIADIVRWAISRCKENEVDGKVSIVIEHDDYIHIGPPATTKEKQ